MDICIMELSTYLFFIILIRLTASELKTGNITMLLYSICFRFMRYILYGQELEEQHRLVTNKNRDSIPQSEKLYEIDPKEPLDNDLLILKIHKLPMKDSTTNLLIKDKPTTGLTITSCLTERDNTYSSLQEESSDTSEDLAYRLIQESMGLTIDSCSTETNTNLFLQDVSSKTSEDLGKFQEPESLLDLFTRKNRKGFEIPVALTGIPENELQKDSVMEIAVDTVPICSVMGKASDGKIFSVTRSEEVVQFSFNNLKRSLVALATSSCPITTRTDDYSFQVGAIPSELVVDSFEASGIDEKLPVEERHSSQNVNSKGIRVISAEDEAVTQDKDASDAEDEENGSYTEDEDDASDTKDEEDASDTEDEDASDTEDASEECATSNIIKEIKSDEIYCTVQSSLDKVPIEFLYPCLPYLNP